MEKLPKNWVEVQLKDFSEIVTGNTPSKSYPEYYGTDIPWVKPGDINKGTEIFKTEEYLTEIGAKKSRMLPKGSVMVTCIGNLGNVAIAGKNLCTNQQINSVVISHNLVEKKYIYYYSLTLKPWLIENSTSTTIAMINKSNFEKAPILLPPLEEQQRIVTKLDLLFGQLDIIKNSLNRVPQLLKIFRQQVLTQAVTGKLTEEWRKGKDLNSIELEIDINIRNYHLPLPKKWRAYAFSDVADIKSNLVNPDDFLNLPLIAPDNIEALTGKLLSKPLTSEIRPISGKHFYAKGCIIYSKIRPYLSKVIIADFEGLCSADMYPVIPKFNLKYVYYYMLSELFLSYANSAGERSVLPKINQKGLSIIPVPFPPLVEQQEIVSRIESLFIKADAIEQQYVALKEKVDNLPQAILRKAFKGELTEQLDTDGDAADLLKEIQKLKESVTKTKKQKPYATNEKLRMVAEPK